jgi:hypothetical protein
MALATLHVAAIPLLAGLAAGTGAVATYVTAPAEAQAPATAQVRPCEAQTWPYIDRACVTDAAPQTQAVRIVTAPRAEDAFEARWSDLPGMTSSDGVLRAPQNIEAIPDAPAAAPPKAKRSEKKSQPRRSERIVREVYRVPSQDSGEPREILVTRPARLDFSP